MSSEKLSPAAATESNEIEAPSAPDPPPSSQPAPDTPTMSAPVLSIAKPKRSKKKGRNQYTKDREAREETSPVRSQSRDVQGHESGPSHHVKAGEGTSKSHSRIKGGFNSKVSMTDMRRKAHAMLDYISRTQVEMAGEITPLDDEGRRPSSISMAPAVGHVASASHKKVPNVKDAEPNSSTAAPKEFKDLTSIEMMDILTRDLVKWQKEFSI